jgi:hypothetical protein
MSRPTHRLARPSRDRGDERLGKRHEWCSLTARLLDQPDRFWMVASRSRNTRVALTAAATNFIAPPLLDAPVG